MEIFKTIKKCPDYEVSNLGNVRNKLTKKLINQKITPDGYNVVYIKDYDFYPKLRVHRLVYEAFNNNDLKGKEIDHIDGNKNNNTLSNLEIVAHKENMIRAVKNKLINTNRPLKVFDIKENTVKELRSICEFEQLINKDQSYIIHRIKNSAFKPILNRYQVINPPNDLNNLVNNGGKKPKSVKIVNKITNEEKIYLSYLAASYDLGVSMAFINKRIKNKNRVKRVDSFPYNVYLNN